MNHEEVKRRLLLESEEVRRSYENPPLSLAVARAVVERRRELGMTQEELAKKLRSSQSQVWRIESGHANPTASTLSKLEEALEISLAGASRDGVYKASSSTLGLSPEEQLDEWRRSGLVIMSDEDFRIALELEDQLRSLVRTIRRIKAADGLEPGDAIQVTLTVRVEPNQGATEDTESEVPESKKHLELVTCFA